MDNAKVTRKGCDFLMDEDEISAAKRRTKRMFTSLPPKEDAIALIGPTGVQLTNSEEFSSTDLRQLICSLFVDSIISTVPRSRRKNAQKELVDLMQRLKIVSSDYFTDGFSNARRPLSLLISKFVIQACQQGSSFAFTPTVDSPLSMNANSRYLNDFEEISRIGAGGFGKVFKVRSLVDNQLYAIKQIRFDSSSSDSFAKVLSECRYHASLQNEHVVRYHNAWVEFEANLIAAPKNGRKRERNLSVGKEQSIQYTQYDWNSSKDKRVFECSDENSITSSHPDPKNNENKGGKFWQSRRSAFSSPQLSRSTSNSDDEEISHSFPQAQHFETNTTSSVSVKFALSEDNANDGDDDGVHFVDESRSISTERNGAMVLWSETQSQSMRRSSKSHKASVHRSSSSPSFTSTISNKNVVNLDFGIPVLYIQMELCSSTLEKYLIERKALNIEFNEATVFALLSAIDFLHKNQLIHRDVKPSNILLKRRNGHWCALLGDFGLTREVNSFAPANQDGCSGEICRINMVSDSSKLTGGIGTALYAAPEQIASHEYGPMVDVYSAGIVFYELFQMFSTSMERIVALTKLRENARPTEKFRLLWPEICGIIERMIPVEPNDRWPAGQILSHLHTSKNQQHCWQNNLPNASGPNLLVGAGEVVNGELSLADTSRESTRKTCNSPVVTTHTTNSSVNDPTDELKHLRQRNAELEIIVEKLQRELAVCRRKSQESDRD